MGFQKMTKKLYIKTYGCQMNVYDSEKMADILKPYGYELTDKNDEADLIILNTCHIREKAEQKMYSDLGRVKEKREIRKKNGDQTIIAVGGCVAQAEGAEIMRQAPFVDIVFGPQTYHRLPEMIARATRAHALKTGKGSGILDIDFPAESKFDSLPQTTETKYTAFLSIQEGCDKFCSFCVVPYTRGAEFSRPGEDILTEARHLVSNGTKEITLLGQNVNAYHGLWTTGETLSLAALIEKLAVIPGLEKIRYTTSHPRDMTADLILAHKNIPQLMPYLHLPVQSGSNRILEAMNRKHDRDLYFKIIEDLRQARPDIALSSDFIVGFPGETEDDFEETLDLIRRVQFAQAYSFKYSIRPGTPGGLLENQIQEAVKSERLQRLQSLLNEHQHAFNEKTVGKTLSVLIEKPGKIAGQLWGKSPYMQSVLVVGNDRLCGQTVDVLIKEAHPNSIRGEIVTSESTVSPPLT